MDRHWLKRHTQRRPAQCQVAGHAHGVSCWSSVRQVQQEGSSNSWKRGNALVHKRPAGEILSALAGSRRTLKRGEKSIAESQGASSPCTDKSATAAKAFATRGYKPQGLEESLANSACAISAIKLFTDDCGCHPRTVLALLASPHRWTGSAGLKRCSSERTYRFQSSPRLAKAVCVMSRTECVVPLARMKSSAVD